MTYLYACPDCGDQREVSPGGKPQFDAGVYCGPCHPLGEFYPDSPDPRGPGVYRRVWTAPALTRNATPTRT